jgi:hypothetical protein
MNFERNQVEIKLDEHRTLSLVQHTLDGKDATYSIKGKSCEVAILVDGQATEVEGWLTAEQLALYIQQHMAATS